MDECSELSLGEYLLRFPDAHTALSDACILQAAECGRMYCERSEDVYKGFVCTAIGSAEEHILYAYTRPAYRGRGIFSSLVKHVVQTGDRDVRISIPEKHPCFTEVDAVCERLGFIPSVRMHTFTVTRSQKEQWQKIKEAGRYDACCARMLCHGCEVVSFAEAGEATISQIRDSRTSGFRNPLDPSSFFTFSSRKLAGDMSFAVVKKGRLLGYTLLSRPSTNAVIMEQMAVAQDVRMSGVVMIPLVCSVDRFFASDSTFFSFAIYENNLAPNRIRMRLQEQIHIEERITRNYRKRMA